MLLRDTFGFHPLAVEDAEHFGQRPKLDSYDDFALLVVFGATLCRAAGGGPLLLHRELSGHRPPRPVPRPGRPAPIECDSTPVLGRTTSCLLYQVVDALVDGYFPVLASLDDQIDELEDEILQRPTEQQLGQLFDMKRSLIALRKVVTPQRDMFATLLSGAGPAAGYDAGRRALLP